MGYRSILWKDGLPKNHKSIALGIIYQGMGRWLPGYGRKNPWVEVSVISNFSRVYRRKPAGSWRGWVRRLGIF